MSEPQCNSPIFIVGVPRSGTTLLAASLASHSNLSCGTETDFFHFLAQVDEEELCASDKWPNEATDFMFRQIPGAGRKSIPQEYEVSRIDLAHYLGNHDPSIGAILAAMTEQQMNRVGKKRWIEKTPNHLLYVEKIRQVYPDSKVIRIVRDPRDTALSILKAPWDWAPRTLPGALSMWRYMDDLSSGFFDSDSNSCTVRFEELVSDSASTLSQLCDFIDEDFEDGMLTRETAYSRVNRINEPWKEKVAEQADSARIEVWRRELDEKSNALAEGLIGDLLIKYQYPRTMQSLTYASIYPRETYLRYPDVADYICDQGLRMWPSNEQESADVQMFVGFPEQDNWFGHKLSDRITSFFSLCHTLVIKKTVGAEILWFKPEIDVSRGIFAWASQAVVRLFGQTISVACSENRDERWRFNLLHNPRLAAREKQETG
ncbi:MAG: sulfotransferase [Pseudomonadota bacterium]